MFQNIVILKNVYITDKRGNKMTSQLIVEDIKGLPDRAKVQVLVGNKLAGYWTMPKEDAKKLQRGETVNVYTYKYKEILKREGEILS